MTKIAVQQKTEDKKDTVEVGRKRVIFLVPAERIGHGSDELGGILVRSFLHTIKETESPSAIILANGGVKLATEGSPYLVALEEVSSRNVDIMVCGACLDFFGLKEKVRVGRICNMFEIISSCMEATSVITV